MPQPRVTERSFYRPLMDIISSKGGQSVSEIQYNSEPDIKFELGDSSWLLSVKIGETPKITKDAFLQYWRHKRESNIRYGIILLLPESMRFVPATENAIRNAVYSNIVTVFIDADFAKEELRDRPFPGIIDFISKEILIRLSRRQSTYYSLKSVISVLQHHVEDMMNEIEVKQKTILNIITDKKLLMNLGHLNNTNAEAVAKFLASYIFLSQILFLRLLKTARPDFFTIDEPVTHFSLRKAFHKILDINYKPIYEFDVLDSINEKYLRDTFDLIWSLAIEQARHELPGRIFHELMPGEIRKMLAAFYTRPQAADLLAQLCINRSEEKIFDLASGSGTILTAAYKRKLQLFKTEHKPGNPHKRFCEYEIFGADIMPFAVHLTSANIAAMDPGETISRTQIIHEDSLKLKPKEYRAGMQTDVFPKTERHAHTSKGDPYIVNLAPVDVILINPPFTKVERGVQELFKMKRFSPHCGGEVGLWGHFIFLSDTFLKQDGIVGAVIPINVLRGRESEKVRKFLFQEWTPLYILKPIRNYGFSEWAEYRDILFIGYRKKPPQNHKVKFCLVKKDLTKLSSDEVNTIAENVKTQDSLQNNGLVQIKSHKLSDINDRFANMMWFCGVTDFRHKEIIVMFLGKFSKKLNRFPVSYFREGYRPVPKGVSKFLFLTRNFHEARIKQAFLRFNKEDSSIITAYSPLNASYKVEFKNLTSTLRTPVGIKKMNITYLWDYIAHYPYKELKRVCSAAGKKIPKQEFWLKVERELQRVKTNIVVNHRINPFSPSTFHNAFFSQIPISPSNQFNVIVERDSLVAQAVCVLLNSIIFYTQFFLLKEESTGRYINVRFYDLDEMILFPPKSLVKRLVNVYNRFNEIQFPSLREQFDENFDQRYKEFWEKEGGVLQTKIWNVIDQPVKPSSSRLNLDIDICNALGVKITKEELIQIYTVLVNEMIMIRRLKRD
ncbi:N-6 DNA methylase [candidate division KSB1 bacterium]